MDLLFLATLFQDFEGGDAAGAAVAIIAGLCQLLFVTVIIVALVAGMWRMFEKAGKPGWAAIVPLYNTYILLEIVGRPIWWLILFFVPIANLVATVVVAIDTAQAYGKGVGFGIATIFFPYVTYPMLGFGDATYVGPVAEGKTFL